MALAACLLGYGEVGLWLKKEAAKPGSWVKLEGNVYLRWIEDYSGEQYQGAVKLGLGECTNGRMRLDTMELAFRVTETIEALAVEDPPNALRFKEWCTVWEKCTRLERGFWDAALNLL